MAVAARQRRPIEAEATGEAKDQVKSNPSKDGVLDAHNRALWRKEQPSDFSRSEEKEPHAIRRKEIIAKYPQIMELYKPDPWSAAFCLVTVIIQLSMAYLLRHSDWWVVMSCSYVVSGTMNHSLVLAMHELSHDLWFKTKWMNTVYGWLINCPTCVASASTFKRYHLEHHSFQGSDIWDADIPTKIEGKMFNYTITKMLWVALQPFFYGLRPIITKPKPVSVNEIINWVIVGGFDFLVVHFWGAKAFAYLLGGSLLGLGLHPMAGHFIAEHFEFIKGQETYSYYGPLNFVAYNVGYHNEHHDFPKVPGRLLPKITEIAPEYYTDMPYYDSWTKVLIGFIFYPNMNCFCRVTRKP
jgi:sphingolipid delta-4 desaturase